MNKDEFEEYFAKGSHTTVEKLHEWGLFAIPCECGEEICKGWKMDWENRETRKLSLKNSRKGVSRE